MKTIDSAGFYCSAIATIFHDSVSGAFTNNPQNNKSAKSLANRIVGLASGFFLSESYFSHDASNLRVVVSLCCPVS